jgi:hypothetical protein
MLGCGGPSTTVAEADPKTSAKIDEANAKDSVPTPSPEAPGTKPVERIDPETAPTRNEVPEEETGNPQPPQKTPQSPATKSQPKPVDNTDKNRGQIAVPPGAGERGWTRSRLTPAQVARDVDGAIANLTNTQVRFVAVAERPQGSSTIRGESLIGSRGLARIQYPIYGRTEREAVDKGTLYADGARFATVTSSGRSEPKPLAEADFAGNRNLATEFPTDFGFLLFSRLVDGSSALVRFVEAMSRPDSGYVVLAEDRTILDAGRPTNLQRLLIERRPEQAKNLGSFRMVIMLNSRFRLPTEVRLFVRPPKGLETRMRWEAAYARLRDGGQISPGKFAIPSRSS